MNRRGFSSCARVLKSRPVRSSSKDPMDIQSMQEFNFPLTRPAILLNEQRRIILNFLRLEEFQFKELAQLRQKFKPPTAKEVITIRSIHYQGESHPVTSKAILTVKVSDLPLNSAAELHKFKLLAGPRYDFVKDSFKISSESFPIQAMNLKWCSDTLDKLITEAQDQTDSFADVPLDLRPTQSRLAKSRANKIVTIKDFPKEWLSEKITFPTPTQSIISEELETVEEIDAAEKESEAVVVPW